MGDGAAMEYTSEYSPTPVIVGQPDTPIETYEKMRTDSISDIYETGFRCWFDIPFFYSRSKFWSKYRFKKNYPNQKSNNLNIGQ